MALALGAHFGKFVGLPRLEIEGLLEARPSAHARRVRPPNDSLSPLKPRQRTGPALPSNPKSGGYQRDKCPKKTYRGKEKPEVIWV